MTDYTKVTNFAVKDTLVSGNPAKIIRGAEFETEFTAIETAVVTKANLDSPVFTGDVTSSTGNFVGPLVGNVTGNVTGNLTGTASNANLLDNLDSTFFRDASNLNTGTISDARLPSTITSDITGTAANANLLDNLDSTFFRNASNLNTGTISDARLPATITSNITGNANTASTLQTSRTISLTGDVSGSTSFNGGSNVSINAVVADNSHNHTSNTGNYAVGGDLTVNGGDIVLNGTGRIQGIDTVSASTDAASKGYVDTEIGNISVEGNNAGTLDGLDSTQFLRSDVADTFTSLTGTTLTSDIVTDNIDGTGNLVFERSGSEKARLTSDGKLGIGTTSPSVKVEIDGGDDSTVTTNLALINGNSGSGGVRLILGHNATDRHSFIESQNENSGNAHNLVFATNISGNTPAEHMRLTSDGKLGIGTTTPSAKLGVQGDIVASGDVTAFGTASDIRLKENIEPITNALESVQAINGYTFNYKDNQDIRVAGVIAQEIEKVLPEVVYETNDGNKAVRYGNIVSLLIEAIKEQQEQIELLKEKVNGFTD